MSSSGTAVDRRIALWDALLDADMNVRYWKLLSQRYSTINNYYRVLLAISSSATVAAWGIWSQYPYAWKALSAISCLASLIYPIFLPTEKLKKLSGLAGAWQQMRTKYELFWSRDSTFAAAQTWDDFERTRQEEDKIDESDFTTNSKLVSKAQDQVRKARGLPK